MAVWRWWGDGGCEAARRSATVAAASRKCEPRAAGGQSRAGAVTAAGVRWCCEAARRSAAVAAASRCGPLAAGGFSHDSDETSL